VSIHQASCPFPKTSSCGIEPVLRLYPSPCQVRHLRSPCLAPYVRPHHHCPHLPHCQNIQDLSDCLRSHSASHQMSFRAFWWSITRFQQCSNLLPSADSLSLSLQLAFSAPHWQNSSLRQIRPSVSNGFGGSDGTLSPLTDNYTVPVGQVTLRVAYIPLLLSSSKCIGIHGSLCRCLRVVGPESHCGQIPEFSSLM